RLSQPRCRMLRRFVRSHFAPRREGVAKSPDGGSASAPRWANELDGLFFELGRRTGGGPRGRAQGRGRGSARRELDDPEAQDAVRDLEVVVQLLQQRGRATELNQV